jgi:FkbM family methyltransferase
MRIVSSVEPEVERVFLDAIGPEDVVFDVGANIGWFSLLAARKARSVVAFEPNVSNAAVARRNAARNGFENMTVVAGAVGDRDGWATFDDSTSLKGNLSDAGSTLVPVVRLDSWLESREPPSVMKIDVEGAEGAVLGGMRDTLRSARPTLIIELHGTNSEVADLLEDAGYGHAPIDHLAPTRDAPWWVHVLAKPL